MTEWKTFGSADDSRRFCSAFIIAHYTTSDAAERKEALFKMIKGEILFCG